MVDQPTVLPDAVGNAQGVEHLLENGFVLLEGAYDDAVFVQRSLALEDSAGNLENLRPRGRGFDDFDRGSGCIRREVLGADPLQWVAGESIRHRDH